MGKWRKSDELSANPNGLTALGSSAAPELLRQTSPVCLQLPSFFVFSSSSIFLDIVRAETVVLWQTATLFP